MTGVVSALRRANAGARVHVVEPAPGSAPQAPLIERASSSMCCATRSTAAGRAATAASSSSRRPPGLGKTALLEHAARWRPRAGCLRAPRRAGPARAPLPVRRRARAAGGAAARGVRRASARGCSTGPRAPAGALLLEGTVPGGDATMPIAHSVLWLCSALAERRPLALVVDDAQWADRSSLEVLSYLARRIDDLPLLIVVGARADDPDAPSDLLSLLGGARVGDRAAPPAADAARRGAADPPRWRPTRPADGLPRLPSRGRRQPVAARASSAARSPRTARARSTTPATTPPPVTAIARNVVRRRLAELSPARPRGRRGARRDRRRRAARTSSPPSPASRSASSAPARDALLAAGLLGPGGERFAHGLIAGAIARRTSPRTERERLHREAARALMAARRRRRRRRQPPARVRPAGRPRGQRAAAARRGRRRRSAARRTPPPPTSSAR